MPNTIIYMIVPFSAGLGLGVINYSGLWLTVRNIGMVKRPELMSLVSFLTRMGISIAGFYIVMAGHWERLVASLAGFFLIRAIMILCLKPKKKRVRGKSRKYKAWK